MDYLTGAVVIGVFLLGFLQTRKQPGDSMKVSARLKMDPTLQNTADIRKGGVKYTENNLAYFDTPLQRHRSNAISFYEAESMQNYHDTYEAMREARRNGDVVGQVAILAEYNRAKDNALMNVPENYNKKDSHIQIRRNELNGRKRILETVVDHPMLADASKWVPHYRSVPLPHSFGKNYWRPNQYMLPGWTFAKD